MLRPPCLQIVMMKFPFCAFQAPLLWFRVIAMTKFFFHALWFLVPPSLPVSWFALALPRMLVAVGDALLGMVGILCKALQVASSSSPPPSSPLRFMVILLLLLLLYCHTATSDCDRYIAIWYDLCLSSFFSSS
jgi:hypothetical protein